MARGAQPGPRRAAASGGLRPPARYASMIAARTVSSAPATLALCVESARRSAPPSAAPPSDRRAPARRSPARAGKSSRALPRAAALAHRVGLVERGHVRHHRGGRSIVARRHQAIAGQHHRCRCKRVIAATWTRRNAHRDTSDGVDRRQAAASIIAMTPAIVPSSASRKRSRLARPFAGRMPAASAPGRAPRRRQSSSAVSRRG